MRRVGRKFKSKMAFTAGKSQKAVTTALTMKFYRDMNIMDTPGFNDPDSQRSDPKIFSDICRTL